MHREALVLPADRRRTLGTSDRHDPLHHAVVEPLIRTSDTGKQVQAFCGAHVYVRAGDFDSNHPRACPRCKRELLL